MATILIVGTGVGLVYLIEKILKTDVFMVSDKKKENYPELLPSKAITINRDGGLDIDIEPDYVTTNWLPKLGHPKHKTNKLRCRHNAKLKRR